MKQQDTFFLVGLVIFCVLTSFMFIFYGVNVAFADNQPQWLKIFAYVTAGYGMANMYLLSWAWRGGATWAGDANKLMGFCYLGVFVFNTVNADVQSVLEYVGIIVVAVVLWINWFAVKKVALRKE
jgi:zinc transporter ZupT